MSTHACPGQCGRSVSRSRLACPDCWQRLPEPFQRGVTTAYTRMRRNPADASRAIAHRVAVSDALAWYRQNTGARDIHGDQTNLTLGEMVQAALEHERGKHARPAEDIDIWDDARQKRREDRP